MNKNLSGNQRSNVAIGGKYAKPIPVPAINPYPAQTSGSICVETPVQTN